MTSTAGGGRQEEPPFQFGDRDVEEMDVDELREQYYNLSEVLWEGYAPHIYDWHEDAHARASEVWNELHDRVDVEQPECPECGHRDWAQSPGDPKHCRNCHYEVFEEPELRKAIDHAWEIIQGGEVDE